MAKPKAEELEAVRPVFLKEGDRLTIDKRVYQVVAASGEVATEPGVEIVRVQVVAVG